jgi:hypothetical protein
LSEHPFPANGEDTTVSIPPGLDFAAVRAIVAQLQANEPEHHERIGRAVNVLLTSEIVATAELGRYLVQSGADGKVYYTATTWACSCPDRQRHATPCKHSYALTVLHALADAARYTRAQTRVYLTSKGNFAAAGLSLGGHA